MATPQRTTQLAAAQIPAAAALSAAAFLHTPSYAAIVADEAERASFLRWLFERNYEWGAEHGVARVVLEGEELIAFFMFERPGLPPPSFVDMVRNGLLTALWRYGLAATRRLLATKSWFEAWEAEVLGPRAGTVARLERVTVLPARQGRGVGSRALREVADEADAEGLAIVLYTQDARNVTFYSRLGFEVIAERDSPVGGGYRNWMMLREPVTYQRNRQVRTLRRPQLD